MFFGVCILKKMIQACNKQGVIQGFSNTFPFYVSYKEK